MRAILHPDLKLSRNQLYDSAIGATYVLSSDGAWLLRRLAKDGRLGTLANLVARVKGIDENEARQTVCALLGKLNMFGLVTLHGLGSFRMTNRRIYIHWRVRYPGTIRGFARSMARAYGLLVTTLTALFSAIGIAAGGNLPVVWIALPAILFASCVLHEAGHALAARKNKVPFVFLAHHGYTAILYARPGYKTGRLIALCGPLPVGVLYLSAALLPAMWPIRLSLAAAGMLHLLSILPLSADGKSIWRRHD